MWEIEAQKYTLGDKQTASDKKWMAGTMPKPYASPSLL